MGKYVEAFEVCMGRMESGREMWKVEDYWSSVMKNILSRAWQTSGCKRKIAYITGGYGAEIDFVLVGKK